MNKIDNFKIGIAALSANKLRTFLTMLGIIFGVGAVIAMLSIGEGARQETLEQINLLGTNNIIIKAKQVSDESSNSEASFSPGLNTKDAASIEKINPFVEFVTPQREFMTSVLYKSNIIDAKIVGTSVNYPQTFNSNITAGSFFTDLHFQNSSNVCVLGSAINEQLFKYEDPVYKQIKINDQWFRVVGVVGSKNTSSTGINNLGISDFNNEIYIPFSTAVNKFKTDDDGGGNFAFGGMVIFFGGSQAANVVDKSSVNQLTVKVKDDTQIREAASLIDRIINRRHYGIKDYEIIIPEQLLAQKQKTQRIFNVVMGAIAGISLLVGGIGIMNIMLANILERTREIGIRRAVGASQADVLSQFMYEAVTISILGGLIGVAVGFILTSLITGYAEWRTIITPFSVILAFFVSVLVGIVFGIYPARQAAAKDPIEALRYE
jgi:putative ABC transport system permease protein